MNKVVACALLLWAGALLGVSFIATPAKFMAESLTLASAVDVGRVTFACFNKIEWVFFVVICVCTISRHSLVSYKLCLAALFVLLCVQTFFLFPELALRAADIISEKRVSPTLLHFQYVTLEVVKLFLVGIWAVSTMRSMTIE